ncbi:hypothetical protein KEH51_26345 [[Brevibacterium] frigoritolerans]|uniref:Uncharacterized protein n=1 Tax=Peribacillus frigoritolerans TaxID=450367 RepID=A0A941FT12_9BACI|nr:hypothetical protein [Peribacillus frigoritolerans]
MFVLLIGMLLGDIIYSGLLAYHSLPYVALAYAWHDNAVLVLGANILWRTLELVANTFIQFPIRDFYQNKEKRILINEYGEN